MKFKTIGLVSLLLALSGCATTGTTQQAQVDRITPEELAKLMPPPVATVTLEEIVIDSKQGKKADEIIEKIKASNSRYDLAPTQVVDLSKQGVDSKVLDYIHQSNELAKQNAMAEEINRREKEKRIALEKLRQERQYSYEFYYGYPYGFYPYGFYPYGYPYWYYPHRLHR